MDLGRRLAPFGAKVWEALDEEATRILKHRLVARRLVDFRGPLGWSTAGVSLGRTTPLAGPALEAGVDAALRRALPLVELRAPFALDRDELDAIARGADDPNLDPLLEAATRIARAEDHAVFHGHVGAGIEGILSASAHEPLRIEDDYTAYPRLVAEALDRLDRAGVAGPYALALGPRCWVGLMQASANGGFPVLDHVRRLVEERIVRAPMVDGAVVLSTRGGDFELTVGGDLSLAYLDHDLEQVRLTFVESMTFRLVSPEAAVPLRYP